MRLLLLLAFLFRGGPIDGYAAHYSPGVFEQVRINRGLPKADCLISSDWHPLGTWVRVEGRRTGAVRVCEVADVSAPADRARHLRAHLFELDFRSAAHICGSTRLANRECPIRVEDYHADHHPVRVGRLRWPVVGVE